jgi:hypothetical protein
MSQKAPLTSGPPLETWTTSQLIHILERLSIPDFEEENPSGQEQGHGIGEGQGPIMIDQGIRTPQHHAGG